MDTSNIRHPLQVAGKFAQAFASRKIGEREDAKNAARQTSFNKTMAQALAIPEGGIPGNPTPSPEGGFEPPIPAQSREQAMIAQLLQNPDTAPMAAQLGLSRAFAEPKERFTPVRDDAGNIVGQESSASGLVSSDPRALKPRPSKLLTPEEFAQQQDLRRSGSDRTNLNLPPAETEFQKGLGKGRAGRFNKLQDEATEALTQQRTLDALGGLLDQVESQGPFAGASQFLKRTAVSLGIELQDFGVADDTAPAQAATALTNAIALRFRNPESGLGLTGNTSDRDVKFLKSLVPDIGNTKAGRQLMIDVMRRVNQRKVQTAELARGYVTRNQTFDAGFAQELQAFADQNPMFEDLEGTILEINASAKTGIPRLEAAPGDTGTNPTTGASVSFSDFQRAFLKANPGATEEDATAVWGQKYVR